MAALDWSQSLRPRDATGELLSTRLAVAEALAGVRRHALAGSRFITDRSSGLVVARLLAGQVAAASRRGRRGLPLLRQLRHRSGPGGFEFPPQVGTDRLDR
jgi:hypothetical protein